MLILNLIYLIFFILGFHFGLLRNPYDELRVIQLILVFASLTSLLMSKSVNSISRNDYLLNILFLFLSLFIINFNNIFQVYDLVMWLSLWFIFFSLSDIDYNKKYNELILNLLVVISILPCFFLPIVIYEFVNTSKMYDWQMNSSSIRIYDSYIVPVFWLAIFFKFQKNKIIKPLYPIICFLITLALLIDGARSALLSIVLPLILILILDKKNKNLVLLTFLYLGLAFFFYKLMFLTHNYFSGDSINMNIARFSTSYRYEIWVYMFEKWLESPLLGTGGGYLAEHHFKYGHHMHNAYLRLIFEWGILGIFLSVYIFYKLYYLFKSNISITLKMGVLAILIDAAFSGNFIYPASQVACVLFFAIAFSEMRIINGNQNKKKYYSSKILVLLYGIAFTLIIIVYLRQDFLCLQCSSMDGRAAPFFWEHGGNSRAFKILNSKF